MTGISALAGAYLRTRTLAVALNTRARIASWQRWNIQRLRRHAINHTPYYGRLGDVPFEKLPIVAKAGVMAAFEEFNSLGLTTKQAWDLLERGQAPPGHDLGCSTGTSGNRGLYLIADRERFVWLGTILAKAIPDVLVKRHRVAVVLPRASRLFESANESRLLTLQFLDLGSGLEAIASALARFRPTVIVSPPKVLRWLAETNTPVAPERLFASAEVLDAPDRAIIEAAFHVTLRQIYMATEGLFGVSCRHGTLHLAEDVVHFEYESVAGESHLVAPVVTDFTRRTQILARYRMNDLLRLDPTPCRCGSGFQAVAEVIGRRDDIFVLPSSRGVGATVTLTPDILRNAVLGTDARIDDFRIRQTGANAVTLVLPPGIDASIAQSALSSVGAACARAGASPEIVLLKEPLQASTTAKLRRIENQWKPTRDGGAP